MNNTEKVKNKASNIHSRIGKVNNSQIHVKNEQKKKNKKKNYTYNTQ